MSVSIEVSCGELIDKITILEIKSVRIMEQAKLHNIQKELEHLSEVLNVHVDLDCEALELIAELRKVNNELWDVEDQLRDYERKQLFDSEFITLARSVYKLNDQRSAIKKTINIKLKSDMIEEKSYVIYASCDVSATVNRGN